MALYGPIYGTLLKMSRSNEFKEQGFACRCSVTDSQFGDLAASVPSPVELVSLVFACPLPRCEIERNSGSCRADPTRSARWPARVNLAAFWQQIAPIVPFLPTLPTAKYCTVCYLQIAAHLDTEEVSGSNPLVPTNSLKNQQPTAGIISFYLSVGQSGAEVSFYEEFICKSQPFRKAA